MCRKTRILVVRSRVFRWSPRDANQFTGASAILSSAGIVVDDFFTGNGLGNRFAAVFARAISRDLHSFRIGFRRRLLTNKLGFVKKGVLIGENLPLKSRVFSEFFVISNFLAKAMNLSKLIYSDCFSMMTFLSAITTSRSAIAVFWSGSSLFGCRISSFNF